MNEYLGYLQNPIYQKMVIGLVTYLIILGIILFPIRKKNQNLKTAWIIYKSWFFAIPIICFVLGLAYPIPLIGFTLLALLSTKEFFKMTGMYQQHIFASLSYIAIIISSLSIHFSWHYTYNFLPMLLLGCLFLIPLVKNEYKGFIQKAALSLMAYMFIGWSFLHFGFMAKWQDGAIFILYIFILTEPYDTIILSYSKLLGKINFIDKIAPRRSLEGFIIGLILTLLVARGIRNILPLESDIYWISAGLIAALIGGLGDISMGIIRRDLGVKDVGAYIFGRGGFIDRMDRLIFVAPVYYYTIVILRDYYLIS